MFTHDIWEIFVIADKRNRPLIYTAVDEVLIPKVKRCSIHTRNDRKPDACLSTIMKIKWSFDYEVWQNFISQFISFYTSVHTLNIVIVALHGV